ncbi:MAG: hypothetical protein H8E37_04500 [Planctomycetes bacterium]|nr:hypothetical protein [Planctomycetota bacterium]
MTTENPAQGGDGVEQRAQALEAQLAALDGALSSVKRTRRIIIVLFLAFIVLVGFLIKGMADQIASKEYQEKLLAEAQRTLESNSAEYMKEVQLLTEAVTPEITKAFYAQAKKDTPLYAGAFDREKQLLAENLRARIEQTVNDYYDKALDKYEAELIKQFPKAEDEEIRRKLKANLRGSLNKLVQKFYADEFERELNAIYEVWETFPPAAEVEEGDLPLEDQLIGFLFEMLTMKLSGHGTNILDVGAEEAEKDTATEKTPEAPGNTPKTNETNEGGKATE